MCELIIGMDIKKIRKAIPIARIVFFVFPILENPFKLIRNCFCIDN